MNSGFELEGLVNSYKPLFSHLFHLSPTQIDRMDLDDWHRYRSWADDFNKRQAGKEDQQPTVDRLVKRANR